MIDVLNRLPYGLSRSKRCSRTRTERLQWQNIGNGESDRAVHPHNLGGQRFLSRDSQVRTTHATTEGAQAALVEYVARNRDAEIGTERPDDALKCWKHIFQRFQKQTRFKRISREPNRNRKLSR